MSDLTQAIILISVIAAVGLAGCVLLAKALSRGAEKAWKEWREIERGK